MPVSATDELINFVQNLEYNMLPDNVISQVRRCVLDLLGVSIAGSRTQPDQFGPYAGVIAPQIAFEVTLHEPIPVLEQDQIQHTPANRKSSHFHHPVRHLVLQAQLKKPGFI